MIEAMRVVKDPLLRYRVMANVVGVGLVILFFIGLPLRYGFGHKGVVEVVGPLHGFLYIVYLFVAFDLAVRRRWPIWKAILVLGAGTVPLLSFIVERWVTRNDVETLTRQAALSESVPR
jgi:integral membrane protein